MTGSESDHTEPTLPGHLDHHLTSLWCTGSDTVGGHDIIIELCCQNRVNYNCPYQLNSIYFYFNELMINLMKPETEDCTILDS